MTPADDQQANQKQRERGLFDVDALGELKDDRQRGQHQDRLQGPSFALVDIQRRDHQRETDHERREPRQPHELYWKHCVEEGETRRQCGVD
jgi:hypothetical protein